MITLIRRGKSRVTDLGLAFMVAPILTELSANNTTKIAKNKT